MSDGGVADRPPLLLGCDFSSAPNARKSIVVALGALRDGRIQLLNLERFVALAAFENWLSQPGDWVGAFDLPLCCV